MYMGKLWPNIALEQRFLNCEAPLLRVHANKAGGLGGSKKRQRQLLCEVKRKGASVLKTPRR